MRIQVSEIYLCRCSIILLTALLAVGCGTSKLYTGSSLPNKDVSVITLKKGTKGVYILHICQEQTEKCISANTPHSTFEILPGKKELLVHYYDMAKGLVYGVDGTISFYAEPGHKYYLGGEQRDGETYFWMEDLETSKIVAGYKPKQLE